MASSKDDAYATILDSFQRFQNIMDRKPVGPKVGIELQYLERSLAYVSGYLEEICDVQDLNSKISCYIILVKYLTIATEIQGCGINENGKRHRLSKFVFDNEDKLTGRLPKNLGTLDSTDDGPSSAKPYLWTIVHVNSTYRECMKRLQTQPLPAIYTTNSTDPRRIAENQTLNHYITIFQSKPYGTFPKTIRGTETEILTNSNLFHAFTSAKKSGLLVDPFDRIISHSSHPAMESFADSKAKYIFWTDLLRAAASVGDRLGVLILGWEEGEGWEGLNAWRRGFVEMENGKLIVRVACQRAVVGLFIGAKVEFVKGVLEAGIMEGFGQEDEYWVDIMDGVLWPLVTARAREVERIRYGC